MAQTPQAIWRRPDNPGMSCCGEADAYYADKIEFKDGKIIATITDTRADGPLGRKHVPPGTRIEVPANKLKFDKGNPVGHTVIFLSVDMAVLCFVQGTGVQPSAPKSDEKHKARRSAGLFSFVAMRANVWP